MRNTRSSTYQGALATAPRRLLRGLARRAGSEIRIRSSYVEDALLELETNYEDDAMIEADPDSDPFIKRLAPGHSLYVGEDSRGGHLLKQLPCEIHQLIMEYLESDREMAFYGRVCKKTAESLSMSVWRMRFVRTFDNIDGLDAVALGRKYAMRRDISKRWTSFDCGLSPRLSNEAQHIQKLQQDLYIDMIIDLILESNARIVKRKDGSEELIDLNMNFLRNVTNKFPTGEAQYLDILDCILSTEYPWDKTPDVCLSKTQRLSTRILVVQLCLSAIVLHPNYCNSRVLGFTVSQEKVYATQVREPLFMGKYKQAINFPLLLHTVNFFKYHLKVGSSDGLFCFVYGLEYDQYPKTWLGPILAGTQRLGSYWRGAYTFMDRDELNNLRTGRANEAIHSDATADDEFQHISLFFDDAKFPASDWPKPWEAILDSDPFRDQDQTTKRNRHGSRNQPKPTQTPPIMQFWGSSRALQNSHFFGRIHAVSTQQAVHGFQRVTMMQFFADESGEYDPEQVWAYEGCVLPGGRIILGRWKDARANPDTPHETYSGPFIFWNVDRSNVPPVDENEALEFAKTIQDPLLMGF